MYSLTFREKYVFCTAPVDVDNDVMMDRFAQFSEHFASHGAVRLDREEALRVKSLAEDKAPARSIENPRSVFLIASSSVLYLEYILSPFPIIHIHSRSNIYKRKMNIY